MQLDSAVLRILLRRSIAQVFMQGTLVSIAVMLLACTKDVVSLQSEDNMWLNTETLNFDITPSTARRKLKSIGAELAWPSFKNQTSLLGLAFADQDKLPNPPGALSKNVQVKSFDPYVLQIDDFMSDAECEFIIALGADRQKPAMVVQSGDNWYDTQAQTRNNDQVWLAQSEEKNTPLLRHVLKRMHRAVRVPDEYAEALQIGHYKTSTKYEGHIDTDPPNKVARPTTMITYLNDPEEGGFTLFPGDRTDCGGGWKTHPKTGEQVYGALVCCETPELDAANTVRVYPKKGRSAIFFSHNPDGSVNQKSLHIGCPVTKGEKWIAQRWFRYEPYNRIDYAKHGWDPRFDGAPMEGMRASDQEKVHVRSLSHISPKAYLEEHFLSKDELEELETSFRSGKFSVDTTFDPRTQPSLPFLQNITSKIFKLARIPEDDKMEVVFKAKKFSEKSHEDLHLDPAQAVTVITYITAVEEGGELVLPVHNGAGSCEGDVAGCCATSRIKVQPHRGDAVLLFNYGQDGRLDKTATRGHCPVLRGEAIVAEWQFHFTPNPFNKPPENHDQGQPKLKFDNLMDKKARIFWVPPAGGEEVPMGVVEAGGFHHVDSHSGHVFVARDENGDLIDRFTAGNTRNQRFFITTKKGEL